MTDSSGLPAALVPWQHGVFAYSLTDWGILAVAGPDAARFLQGQTSQDIQSLAVGRVAMAAILTPKGQIRFIVTVLRTGPEVYWVLVPQTQLEALQAQLESAHFTEALTFERITQGWHLETIQGPYAAAFCRDFVLGESAHKAPWPSTAETGWLMVIPESDYHAYQAACSQWRLGSIAVTKVSPADWATWTLATGFAQWPDEFEAPMILSETPLEPLTASPTKGCYVGQEVITRIRTQGRPPRSWQGLRLCGEVALPPTGTPLHRGDSTIGTLGRGVFLPELNETWAFARVQRGVALSSEPETFGLGESNALATGRLVSLPFLAPPNCIELSQACYEAAIACVTQHQETQAIALLTQALALNPLHADATEVLGVLYSQTGQIQAAIELMTQLATLDPTSVMAHTNLSRFYLMLGDKDRAETEKAQATVLQFRQAMQGHPMAPTPPSAEEARKMAMFKEVLTLDPEDPLANYSLGNLHLTRGEACEALPYLEQAVKSDPRYSVAYLALGKAYQTLNQPESAMDTFQTGITVAQKQGDWTPLQAMESALNQLKAKPTA